MATITQNWTDSVNFLPKQTLSRGTSIVATLDLRSKIKAFVYLRVGRTTAFALGNGVSIRALRRITGTSQPLSTLSITTSVTAAAITLVNADSSNSSKTLNVQSSVGFSVGDFICVRDTALSRLEWCRISNKTSTTLILDKNMFFSHAASDADAVTNNASLTAWNLEGGCYWDICFDYADDVSGDAVVIEAWAQTHDSDSSV